MAGGEGTVIGGRFRLSEAIGQGGMGRVWRGHDQVLNRDVAIKEVLLPSALSDAERASLLARTTREAQSTARLNHPCVVTIHDVVQHDGVPWIVMEYVPGQSLGALIKDGARLPWARVADIGAKIADALAHAHAAGIVHRDLKPDNVLLSGDRVRVTDFGIARMVDAASRLTSTGTVMGTPHFMAPEQLEGTQASAPTDMWSLGATLYAAVEGTLPFDGPTLTAIITAILARDPAPPVHAGPLAGALADLLTKDPARRPDATSMALRLRAAIAAGATVPSASTVPADAAVPGATIPGATAVPAPAGAPASAGAAPGGAVLASAAAPADSAAVAASAGAVSTPASPDTTAALGRAASPAPATASPPDPSSGPNLAPPSAVPAQPATIASPRYGVPASSFPPTVNTPPPGLAPPGLTPVGVNQRGRDGLAIAGLLLAIVTAVAFIGGQAVSQNSVPGKSTAFGFASDAAPLIVALIALFVGKIRRPLLPYVLGAAFLPVAGVLYDLLALGAYHPLSADNSNHAKVSFLLSSLGDIAGTVGMIMLLITVRRVAGRDRWASPRILPLLLLVLPALSWIAWTAVWARKIYTQDGNNYSDWGTGKFLSVDYPFVAYIVAGLVVAVVMALCALRLQARASGGVMLVGWTVTVFFYFAQIITEGWAFPGPEAALNGAAALLMLATVIVALIYAIRHGTARRNTTER